MRVLGIFQQYVPQSRVGAWITTHEYLRALATRGHTVDVLTTNDQGEYTVDGVHVHPNGTAVRRPDLVVCHLGGPPAISLVASSFRVPVVKFAHGYHPDNALRLDNSALAVFCSQALADDTGWDGPQLVAHPPVFPADYKVRPGACVTLANLNPRKGGDLLAQIAKALPTVEFLAVRGWGQQVETQPANVRIVDPVEDMRDVYRQTRILLVPSERETYGRCAVEAACSGIPTIAHPSPGLVEAMGDRAIYSFQGLVRALDDHTTWVDRDDVDGWIEAVRRLQDHRWDDASARARGAIQTDPEATVLKVCKAIEALALVEV